MAKYRHIVFDGRNTDRYERLHIIFIAGDAHDGKRRAVRDRRSEVCAG